MGPLALSLLFGAIAACANLLGGFVIASKKRWDPNFLRYFIAFGSGFMLTAALLYMVPESIQQTKSAPLLILAGYLLVHFGEHTLASHFHFGEEVHEEPLVQPAVSLFAFAGLLIHTFFDGVSIASGFEVSRRMGLLIFLAVFLHKLPEGFTVASIMLASGRSRAAALSAASTLGAATLVGVLTSHLFRGLLGYRLALSAGVLIYVAASDLIPEVNKEKGIGLALMVFAGVLLFYLTEQLLHGLGF